MKYMRCSLRLGPQHYDAASWARAERSGTSIVSGASGAWTTERMLLNFRGALTHSFASGAIGFGAFTWLIVQETEVRAVVSLMDGPLRELGVQLSGIWVVFSFWAGQFKRVAGPCVRVSGLSSTRTEAPAQAHFVSLSRFGKLHRRTDLGMFVLVFCCFVVVLELFCTCFLLFVCCCFLLFVHVSPMFVKTTTNKSSYVKFAP